MKIRMGYVSNSSSCSFLICGKNIIAILTNFIANNSPIPIDSNYSDYYGEAYVGEANQEIIRQCQQYSTDENIKIFIEAKLYESMSSYYDKYTWGKTDRRCNIIYLDREYLREDRIYDGCFKGTVFELNEQLIEKVKSVAERNKKGQYELYPYWYDDKELASMIQSMTEKIFVDLKKQYSDVYVVSFGDNHGECEGRLGVTVEHEYLGNKSINSILNTDFKIFELNEH